MKTKLSLFLIAIGLIAFAFVKNTSEVVAEKEDLMLSHIVDLQETQLDFYWKNDSGTAYTNFRNLDSALQTKDTELLFAMNGGMFNKELKPQGLYIENGDTLAELDTIENAYGNFYLQPNGIFYLRDDNKGVVVERTSFDWTSEIKYATQSGPMLVIDGDLHPKFMKGSKNLNVRNGVGVLPDGKLLFAMSKEEINLYDFASYFLENGCKNALYLDGSISKTYLPEKDWEQVDGTFCVIIGETKIKD